ncbi:L,D-transpeptidase family protein [Clostridium grantii]|uniref:Putative peptidoglycan binding domain-containing protein n=1 Tax=Clostridium grantii DSM 8605 TaxID=1121316 RepID=A0A1M5RES2_9CLOT|nr:L,D-transpeptidase family protein [Clostridium grantii]SHH24862.1 Putative peptidoglycan binding domain-containing protein [Clostridium grantii DSM 8605]
MMWNKKAYKLLISSFLFMVVIINNFLIIDSLALSSNTNFHSTEVDSFISNNINKLNLNVEITADYNPDKPTIIICDICECIMYVFQENNVIAKYPISGGKPSTPSPLGTWTIISKDTWGEGFGGRWMGFNVPWGKYGIHGTIFPNSVGWNSSHGCIRMYNNDVAELYKITKHGTKVIIWGGPYGNFGSYFRTLKPGMRGSDIFELQEILKSKGYYKANADGIYGDYFKNVVHKFQKDNNMTITDTLGWNFYSKLGVDLIE